MARYRCEIDSKLIRERRVPYLGNYCLAPGFRFDKHTAQSRNDDVPQNRPGDCFRSVGSKLRQLRRKSLLIASRPNEFAKCARPPIPTPKPAADATPSAQRLSGKNVMSAAADWSRWPLGTRFRIVDTDEVFQIDDYGSALIGTGTIDLYKTNRLAMRRWGVRSVDIDILEWGSTEKSLEVLAPRKRKPACPPDDPRALEGVEVAISTSF